MGQDQAAHTAAADVHLQFAGNMDLRLARIGVFDRTDDHDDFLYCRLASGLDFQYLQHVSVISDADAHLSVHLECSSTYELDLFALRTEKTAPQRCGEGKQDLKKFTFF